jgi:TldD protein
LGKVKEEHTNMTNIHFDAYDWLGQVAQEFQDKHDVYTIVRLQYKRSGRVIYKNTRLDGVSESEMEGVGVQLFTRDGESVLGSSNEVTREEILSLLDRSLKVLNSSRGQVEGHNTEIWSTPFLSERRIVETPYSLDIVGFGAIKERLLRHHEVMLSVDDTHLGDLSQTSLINIIEEEWRIFRGDGSSVHWNVPRSLLYDTFTVRRGGGVSATRCNSHERDLRVLMDDDLLQSFEHQARRYRRMAFDLRGAPRITGGHYKIVIDPALAKGLAHEAFGHAAESDAIRFHSILGQDEKFRSGIKVCRDNISIVDSSVEGDWAYAPFSSNGLARKAVRIIDRGVLRASLGDVYSAQEIGCEVTGASRLESYGDVPLPRMSNIRLEIADPLPWPDVSDRDPVKLHDYLRDRGLIKADEEILYLSGYRGGQVNPKLGDYVFNCQAIYKFHNGETRLHQPGLFSGKVLETLESIKIGIGPSLIHHSGTCGKAGQGVPSSGGGPLFTIIDKHPAIHIGGK